MLIRNYSGRFVEFNIKDYSNERDMYIELWKIKYNITIDVKKINTNEQITIQTHKEIKILELLIQFFFLSSGIHSRITLVSKPKACQIISLCNDL